MLCRLTPCLSKKENNRIPSASVESTQPASETTRHSLRSIILRTIGFTAIPAFYWFVSLTVCGCAATRSSSCRSAQAPAAQRSRSNLSRTAALQQANANKTAQRKTKTTPEQKTQAKSLPCEQKTEGKSPDDRQQQEAKCGKYPASLVIKTRTACTYPKGLSVFTLVGVHSDAKRRRLPNKKGMRNLPPGVHNRTTSLLLWGEYGLTDRHQCGIGVPYLFRDFKNSALAVHKTPDGFGDVWLYLKYRWLVETPARPAIASDIWVKTHTGDSRSGLGNSETDVKLTMEVSKRIGDVSLHLNPEITFTGAHRRDYGDAADNKLACNTGLVYHMTPRILPMIELNGLWWGHFGHSVDVGAGALFFLRKNVSLKLGVATPVDVDMPWSAEVTPYVKLATWF